MHNIEYGVYAENVNKKSVQREWDDYVAHEDWQEGACGLPSDIRWNEHICDTKDDAHKWIEEHDRNCYDQLAVKFRQAPKEAMVSSTKTRLEKQIKDYETKYADYDSSHTLTKQVAKFISCPRCSSKLSKEHLRGNGCPVCRVQDIRSKYITETLQGYRDKIAKWRKELAEENKKLAIKAANRSKIMWLVKVEYHT